MWLFLSWLPRFCIGEFDASGLRQCRHPLVSPMVVLLVSSVLNGGVGAFDGLLFLIALIVSLPVSCLVGAVFDASR